MNTFRAGSLRDYIHIQRRLPGGGGLGQPSNSWEAVASTWANIRYASGSETIRSGQIASKAQVSIRIRWRTGITAEMRVLSGALSTLSRPCCRIISVASMLIWSVR
jgi:SPP1 family predicted phage head-tail adaptor